MLETATRYAFRVRQVGITDRFQWRADAPALDWSEPLTVEQLGEAIASSILQNAGSWDAVANINCKVNIWRESRAFLDGLGAYLGLPSYLGGGYEVPEPHLFYRTKDALSGEGTGYWGYWCPTDWQMNRPKHWFTVDVTYQEV